MLTNTAKANVRKLVMTAMLSAVATVLMYLEIPVPLMPGFIKFDFSELPALIAAFGIHPLSGVAVCLVKNLIHLPATFSGGVGELCNFLLGAAFVLPAGLLYRARKTRAGALISCLAGSVFAAAVSFPVNYFISYPIYENLMGMDAILAAYAAILPAVGELWQALLIFNLPFTLAKGILVSAIAFLIYKPISGFLHGRSRKEKKDGKQPEDRKTPPDAAPESAPQTGDETNENGGDGA